jgi:GTP-binding protein LepA
VAELGPGEIGFIIAGIKTIADCKVGDTITDDRKPATEMLAGFKPSVPVVFCGLFPPTRRVRDLRESLSKLRLNDASFHFEPETSAALGFGFRCGFLGCCISRSSRSGWSASSTSTSSPPLRRSSTRSG